jgi:hypothetical protein
MIAPDFLLARQLGTASGIAGTVVPPIPGHQLFPREQFLP